MIEYFIDLTRFFNFYIIFIGKTKLYISSYTLWVYNYIFERLTKSCRKLIAKKFNYP
jgi:hypothetical protein